MAETIVNRVADSGLITLDLEAYTPDNTIKTFDLKDFLFMGLILKEKEFRSALLQFNWPDYKDAAVCVTCSADAIIPVWAYMLVASYLEPVCSYLMFGSEKELRERLWLDNIDRINGALFEDKRVVIKGCGEVPIPESAYLAATKKLRPFAKSIMYGEPCSTVPIYKKQKQ